jgi:hypothetical protein
MKRWQLWVRLANGATAHTIVFACNAFDAKALGEMQYGTGNVLNYTELGD